MLQTYHYKFRSESSKKREGKKRKASTKGDTV